MLGDAHFHYSMGKHSEALALLSEVVRQAPSIPDSYHALGLIYEERQEKVSQSRAVRPRVARRADDARCGSVAARCGPLVRSHVAIVARLSLSLPHCAWRSCGAPSPSWTALLGEARALQLYMIAVHLSPKDLEMWRKVGMLALEVIHGGEW